MIGFFTPNYRAVAEKFARNLTEHGVPFHLFARERAPGKWVAQTLQKPSVVLAAMDRHPGKTLVLMDVDCEVRADIAPVTTLDGDVCLYWPSSNSGAVPSSRVIMLKSTAAARDFATRWKSLCDRAIQTDIRSDEDLLARALDGMAFTNMPKAYRARCSISAPNGTAIVHESENDKPNLWLPYKYRLKAFRRSLVERLVGKPYEDWKAGH